MWSSTCSGHQLGTLLLQCIVYHAKGEGQGSRHNLGTLAKFVCFSLNANHLNAYCFESCDGGVEM